MFLQFITSWLKNLKYMITLLLAFSGIPVNRLFPESIFKNLLWKHL
jgi:hypothetical protein